MSLLGTSLAACDTTQPADQAVDQATEPVIEQTDTSDDSERLSNNADDSDNQTDNGTTETIESEQSDDPYLVPGAQPIAVMDPSLQDERDAAYTEAVAIVEAKAESAPEEIASVLTSLTQEDRFILEGMFDGCVAIENPYANEPEQVTADYRRLFENVADYADALDVYPLPEGNTLVSVLCDRFAYQVAVANYIYSPGQSIPLQLPIYDEESAQPVRTADHRTVGLQSFDSDTLQLSVFQKYRGIGDCGSKTVYQLEGDRLTMIAFNEKAECDGTLPDDGFPQVYP
ncbi:MAG: DUF1176 domain-containing protein [Cyanobacteria bacterium J06573_11]